MQATTNAENDLATAVSPAAHDDYSARTSLPPVIATANDNSPFNRTTSLTPIGFNSPAAHSNIAPSFDGTTPAHTHTESTLAPTSEFMRYVLAALPARYVLRGLAALLFNDPTKRKEFTGWRKSILDFAGKPGDALKEKGWSHAQGEATGYSGSLLAGSIWLTASYTATVYADIKNIFSEAVGAEFNKPADKVNFNDIRHSQNRIVQKTLDNFKHRTLRRVLVDLLFLPAAMMKHTWAGDFVLGLKGVQLFAETWKRKTTMFEDFVTFVNNKINPRNGLGQPISRGEIFDLYQHYAQEFHPERAFSNVLERGTGEGILWARGEPIFERITSLMNQTYAYKHPSIINPETGHAIRQANFALPTFIYLLGHDMIDLRTPERTQIIIEIANKYGIPGVKEARALTVKGATDDDLMRRYAVTIPPPQPRQEPRESEKNGVLIKGSSEQLDGVGQATSSALAPLSQVAAKSIRMDMQHLVGAHNQIA